MHKRTFLKSLVGAASTVPFFTSTAPTWAAPSSRTVDDNLPDPNAVQALSPAQVRQFDSNRLGQMRSYTLYYSPSLRQNPVGQSVTAIYLLDGQLFGETVAGMLGFFESSRLSNLGPTVLIALDTTNYRTRDLTPTPAFYNQRHEKLKAPEGGGAKTFLEFLVNDLRSQSEAGLSVQKRWLMGHSLGGLFTLYALSRQADFDSFVAIDPSLWWNEGKYYATLAKVKTKQVRDGAQCYLAFSNDVSQVNNPLAPYIKDASTKWLSRLESQGWQTYRRIFDHEVHGTVAIPGCYDAIKTLTWQAQEVTRHGASTAASST